MFKWLALATIAGIFTVMGIQLLPVYIQNYAVKKIASEVVSDAELADSPKRKVVAKVQELFAQNDINNLDSKKVVTVGRDKVGELMLIVKYEERRKLLYNLEIVAAFDDEITE